MKKLLVLLILFSFVNVQAQNVEKKYPEHHLGSKVKVTLESTSKPSKYNKNLLESELILTIGKLKPLYNMEVGNKQGGNYLILNFYFDDLDSFNNWYKSERIQKIFSAIKKEVGEYNIKLMFSKISYYTNLDKPEPTK